MSHRPKSSLFPLLLAFALVGPTATQEQADPGNTPGELLVRFSPDRAAIADPSPGRAHASKATARQPSFKELASKYGLVSQEGVLSSRHPGFTAGSAKTGSPAAIARWQRLRFVSSYDVRAIATRFADLEEVEEVQVNFLRWGGVGPRAAVPDDSLFIQQWNLEAIGWETTAAIDASSVLVAVVDSGLDHGHSDIIDRLWRNPSEVAGSEGVDDDGNGYVDDLIGWDFTDAPGLMGIGDYLQPDNNPWDESGHGTHVAGILAATVDNGIGIAGVARGVQLMTLRAGFNLTQGSFFEDDDLAAAIVYAADHGADVINMSWGGPAFSPLLRDAVNYAAESGCVLVAAAGNEGDGPVFVPARLAATIAVGAADAGGSILPFSNFGESIDLAAPGHQIPSLVPGGGYGLLSGTSMAAPHVSGLAALILARNPNLDAHSVRGALVAEAIDLESPGWDSRSGAGLVQAKSAFLELPPIMAIVAPAADAAVEEVVSIEVRIGIDDAAIEYELAWGTGKSPVNWQKIWSAAEGGSGSAVIPWDVATLAPGEYTIRLSGRWRDRLLEDRVVLRVVRLGPSVHNPHYSQMLDSGAWVGVVEWETDVPAAGTVRVSPLGDEDALFVLTGLPQETTHRIQLPPELPSGTYDLWIEAAVGRQLTALRPIRVEVKNETVGRWQLSPLAQFAAGFMLPKTMDLNGNGLVELALMPFANDGYNAIQLHEYGGDGFDLAHTSTRLFLPWNAHDLNLDGRMEIMAVDARRVRLLESSSATIYPNRVVWEGEGVWGGEVGDLDGDGRMEMILRSSRASLFEVMESGPDGSFALAATMQNPTAGANQLAGRQVVADMDGDGKTDFVSADDDGDVFVFEGIGDDALRSSWIEHSATDGVVGALVGGGADLDGDGRIEFVVCRFIENAFAPARSRWLVTVYQANGDNDYTPEWSVQVVGGTNGSNGVALLDVDGDGQLEMALALVPHLYIFSAVGENEYQPFWHEPIGDTYSPATGDVTGDGIEGLVVNGGHGAFADRAVLFAMIGETGELQSPSSFTAVAIDDSTARLSWLTVPGAEAYQVYRNGERLGQPVADPVYVDTGLIVGRSYAYGIAAVVGKTESVPAAVIVVVPRPPPRIVDIEQLTRHQLGVTFDAAMAIDPERTDLFLVVPNVGAPSSVFTDRGSRRVVLSFAAALPDSGRFRLDVGVLVDTTGMPMGTGFRETGFDLQPVRESIRLVAASAESSTEVRLEFSGRVRFSSTPNTGPLVNEVAIGEMFRIDDAEVRIRQVALDGDRFVLIFMHDDTPLVPRGTRYEVVASDLIDATGRSVSARAYVKLAASSLAGLTMFPNPYDPQAGLLTVAGLPVASRIWIHTLVGRLVRRLADAEGDGGLQWDGSNESGAVVADGIYLYTARSGEEVRVGKVVVIRGSQSGF